KHGETAVSFVQVVHARSNPQGAQSARSTHAQQQFLTNPDAAVSSVETRGKLAVFRSIAFHIGIQQEQVTAADFYAPDFGADDFAASVNLHDDGLAVRADCRLHGQLAYIALQVFFLLPAVAVEALVKVSLAVEQSDADQRDSKIGSALDVISRENSQASGINGKGLVQAELGGEIRDWARPQDTCMDCAPRAGRV